jgi:hypothetical protein
LLVTGIYSLGHREAEMNTLIFIWLVQAVLCAILAGIIGDAKGRAGGVYFLLGLLLGVFGLIFAAGMPTTKAVGVIAEQPTSLQPELSEAEKEKAELEKARVALEQKKSAEPG